MGSAASVDIDGGDVYRMYRHSEIIKDQIAHHDSDIIHAESKKIIKDHKQLISTITSKSRLQLRRTVRAYEAGPNRSFSVEVIKKLGSAYGDFIGGLTQPVCVGICTLMEGAFTKYGSNEMLLADLFCLCTNAELHELKVYYDKKHRNDSNPVTLQGLIDGKAIGNLPFWEFIGLILSVDRRSEALSDALDSSKCAMQLHKAGLGNPNSARNDELILSMLAVMSRRQCLFVCQSFQQKFNCSLADAITSTYGGGSCLRALLIWTSPRSRALALSLERILSACIVDPAVLCFTLSRVEKPLVTAALSILRSTFQLDFEKALKKAVKGNCQLAVLCWCLEPSVDKGAEFRLVELADLLGLRISHSTAGGKAVDCSSEEAGELEEEMRSLVRAQHASLMQHADSIGVGKNIPAIEDFTVPVQAAVFIGNSLSWQSMKDSDSPDCSSALHHHHHHARLYSTDEADKDALTEGAHVACADLTECLELWLALLDSDQHGTLPLQTFVDFLSSLEVGYTEDSASELVHAAGWEHMEWVVYPEILSDLAVHMINCMQLSGYDVDERVDALWQGYTLAAENAWDQCRPEEDEGQEGGEANTHDEERVCAELVAYLKDTFDSYDAHNRAYLSPDEFGGMLDGMFGKHDQGEINRLRLAFDMNQDGNISWDEALAGLSQVINDMDCSNGTDQWICLFDKNSTLRFWFNVRDKNSSWVTDIDGADESADCNHVVPSQLEEADALPKVTSRKQRRSTVVLSGMQRGQAVVRLRSINETDDDRARAGECECYGNAGAKVAAELQTLTEITQGAVVALVENRDIEDCSHW